MSKKRVPSSRPPPGRPKNHLLAALPAKDFRRLLPYLRTVPIRVNQVLYKAGELLRAVYFLNGGAASIVTMLSDGIKAKDLEERVQTLDVVEIVDRVVK